MYKLIQNTNNSIIALGHNRDDCIENIFSNIIRDQKYDNLLGMEFIGNEFDVNIIRPFLEIIKEDIYMIANKYNLPYLYDSTPSWSDRGKKRDKLIPFLNNFDNRIIPGLIMMSKYLKNSHDLTLNIIKKNIKFINDPIIICHFDKDILNYNYEIYIEIFSYICKEKKIPFFSKKSILNLYNKISEKRYYNVVLSKNYSFNNFVLIKI